MVEKEINEKLVGDVTRICTIANTWPKAYYNAAVNPRTWMQKAEWVRKQLNKGKEQIFIDTINKILTDQAAEDRINGILDKSYLTNTRTLLKYRIENAGKNPDIQAVNRRALNEKDFREIRSMLKAHGNTVVGYHALEFYGDLEELHRVLEDNLGSITVEIQVVERSEPVIYREKVPYLKHKIWACTQLMPLVILRMIDE